MEETLSGGTVFHADLQAAFDRNRLERLTKKDTPMLVEEQRKCPECGVRLYSVYNYCKNCGQALLWERE